jgi:hypothetical protein
LLSSTITKLAPSLYLGVVFLPVDYFVVEPAPNFEAVPRTRGDVTEDMNLVPGFFGFAELFHQPLQLATRISAVDQQPTTGREERGRERKRERERGIFSIHSYL